MAQKVEIDIPGIGKILAENAASEHTLEELLKVMQGIQKQLKSAQGKQPPGKTPPPGKTAGGAAAGGAPGASAAATKAQQQQTQQTGKSSKGLYTLGVATGVAARGFDIMTTRAGEVTGSLLGLAGSATNLINQFAGVGNSLSAAASVFQSIPVVGGLLAGVFGAVAAAAEKQLGSFQALAGVGATFGGSMTAMTNAASGAGLTVDQFAKIVSSNGQAMAELGGTTEDGAKRFADLGKKMRQSGLGDELLRLGYSTEGINKGMAGYLATMGSSGRLQGASTTQLAQGAATYMKELDGLSKITGQNREDLAKEREKLAKDAQVEAAMQHLDEKQRSDMLTYIQSFPKAQQSAIKDMLATGTITSEEGVKMAAMYPKLASQMQAHGRTLQAGGQISKEAMNTTRNSGIEEARERNKTLKSVGQFNKEMGDTYSGGAELARQKINGLAQASDEQAKTIKAASQAEELEKSKAKLAAFSNTFTNFLASSGLIDTMMSAFETLGTLITAVAIPVFNVFAGVLKAVAPIIEGVASVFLGVLEPVVYGISDFIEDNLQPVMAVLMGAVIGLTAAKVVATVSAWASSAADMAKTAASLPFIASLVAMAAGVWAAVAPFLALAAPILAVVAAVGLLVYGAKKLGVDFKVLSDAASFVGSLIKTVFLQFQKGLFSLLNKIPGMRGDFDEAIKGVDQQLTSEGEKRSQLTDDMGKRMQANQDKDKADKAATAKAEREALRKTNPEEAKKLDARDKRDAEISKRGEQREKDALDKRTEAEKKAAEAKKEETKEVDLSSPQAMLKSFSDQQNGFLSKKIEATGGSGGGKATSAPGKSSSGGGGGGGSASAAPSSGGGGGGKASSGGGGGGYGSGAVVGGGSGKDGGVDGSGGGGDGGKLPVMAKSAGGKGGSMSEPDIKAMITRHEGIRYEPYKDSLGLWTVGVGHLIGDGKTLPQEYNRKFSHEEVMAMFDKDYEKHKKQAESNVPGYSKFDSLGQAALIDLTFNMGPGWPKKFPSTSKKLGAGDTEGAAAGLTDSKWYGQVGNRAPVITGMIRDAKVTARDGGIFDGPKSGYDATLHGAEAVVPLPDGKQIPVSVNDPGQESLVSLLSSLNNKMDQLISINGQLANINSDQLRVQKGFSFGDMFKSPV